MNIGQFLIWAGFIVAVWAGFRFALDGRQASKDSHDVKLSKGRLTSRLYLGLVGAGVLASALLFYLLLTHQFQYSYVAKYSSIAQPTLYVISAFWAGQEGTFLLWALFTSLIGLVLLRKSKDNYAMSIVSLYSAFLYLLMLLKSPFEATVSVPPDGAGMNPLLQDPWMAIHPPILFLGYAATIVPFALIVSGLLRKNYAHWLQEGFAWSLFASSALSAGIIIGGFWAYEVLGWGGYWGWDPVENSSLVPWLVLLALIHGLLVQKQKGSLLRTNMTLGIVSFLLVLYATFLTRSGVLSDFSVHSFVDLGISTYLIGIIVAGAALGFGLLTIRFREIRSPKVQISGLNRELALLLGMLVLCVGAIFTFVGMSSPIITGLVGKASQVDTSFYNKVNMPVAIGMGLLLGITPFLGWSGETKGGIIKRLSMSLALTALACSIAFVAGVRSPMHIVFVGAASFALISNVIIAFRHYRSGWLSLGGPIAHIGVGLLLIGILGSGSFGVTKQIVLKEGEPQSLQGYQFTFKGIDEGSGTKPKVLIDVSDGARSYTATPRMYYSEYNQGMMREPDIRVFALADLYISPVDIKMNDMAHRHDAAFELVKGETKEVAGYQITFARFDMSEHSQAGTMAVGAVLSVAANGSSHEIIPQMVINARGERTVVPAAMPVLTASAKAQQASQITLNGINVEQKKVLVELVNGENAAVNSAASLIVEISTKPLMMVVWTGVVLVILGTVMSFKRRITIA